MRTWEINDRWNALGRRKVCWRHVVRFVGVKVRIIYLRLRLLIFNEGAAPRGGPPVHGWRGDGGAPRHVARRHIHLFFLHHYTDNTTQLILKCTLQSTNFAYRTAWKIRVYEFGSMIGGARAIGLRSGSQRVPGTASVINRKCNRCKCRESFSGRAGPMFIFTPRSVTAVAETISGQIHMIFDRRACSRGWCQFYARSKRAQISRYAEFRPVLI